MVASIENPIDSVESRRLRAEANKFFLEGQGKLTEWDGKEMPADVQAEVKSLFAKVITLGEQASLVETGRQLHRDMTEPVASERLPVGQAETKSPEQDDVEIKAFRKYLRGGINQNWSDAEYKALSANVSDAAGFLVAPQQFVSDLIQGVDDDVVIKSLATVYRLEKALSLGAPSLDTDPSDADWTSEVTTVSEDTAMKVGKRELNPSQLTKLVKISRKLLQSAAISPDALVRERLGYKFAITQEKGFMSGTGSNQPLGIFTAHADGISTSRDVTAANATTVIGDDFIKLKMGLKPQYMKSKTVRMVFHRDILQKLMLEKASTAGTYLFTPGLSAATPDMILNVPYLLSEYAPNTLTTGLYVAVIGEFRYYWIAEALQFEVQVLNELYAANNQVGYIGRAWVDGAPVLEEAFRRLKLA